MHVALDNDVFSKITSSKTNTLGFIELIKSKGYFLYIPSETIRQSFHGGNIKYVANRFENLGLLINQVGINNFRIIDEPFKCFQKEFFSKDGLTRSPLVSKQKLENVLARCNSSEILKNTWVESETARERHFKLQTDLHESDQIQYEERNQDTITNVNELVSTYPGVAKRMSSVRAFSPIFKKVVPYFSTTKFKRVVFNPRHKIIHSFMNLYELSILLSMKPTDSKFPKYLTRPIKGDYSDITLASTCAYVDILVTNDRKLKLLCSFLFEKQLSSFNVLTDTEFQAN